MGDLNTFEFTDELNEDLTGTGAERVLTNTVGLVTENDAYTYVFDGNAQVLDHIFVSDALLAGAEVDIVHVNTDFTASASDHEPIVVSLDLGTALLVGTPGNDFLAGSGKDEILDGLGGNDRYLGGGGVDTFVMGDGERDQVKDFELGIDLIDLTAWGTQGLDGLMITGRNGNINIRDLFTNNTARVNDPTRTLNPEDLTTDSFIFAPTEDLVLTGTDGNDRLVGREGDDVLSGGLGRDDLTGNGGSDAFVLGLEGSDLIRDYEDGFDLIDVSDWGITGFDRLSLLDRPDKVLVHDGENSANIRSYDPVSSAADLAADDFLFATATI